MRYTHKHTRVCANTDITTNAIHRYLTSKLRELTIVRLTLDILRSNALRIQVTILQYAKKHRSASHNSANIVLRILAIHTHIENYIADCQSADRLPISRFLQHGARGSHQYSPKPHRRKRFNDRVRHCLFNCQLCKFHHQRRWQYCRLMPLPQLCWRLYPYQSYLYVNSCFEAFLNFQPWHILVDLVWILSFNERVLVLMWPKIQHRPKCGPHRKQIYFLIIPVNIYVYTCTWNAFAWVCVSVCVCECVCTHKHAEPTHGSILVIRMVKC